jgi:beta-phosphoglucomutase-like phosphatase (HAD superfamily)
LQRLNIENKSSDAIVIENAPLEVKAANKAAIPCVVTLNTSPLTLADFEGLIFKDRIFKDTISAGKFLKK